MDNFVNQLIKRLLVGDQRELASDGNQHESYFFGPHVPDLRRLCCLLAWKAMTDLLPFIQRHILSSSALEKFALTLILLAMVPRLCRRAHIPEPVGLLLAGVIVGPYVLGFFGADRPVADFLAELGKLLLMFFAGLEIDLALFRRVRNRSIAFGLTTTSIPLALGAAVGFAFGYAAVPAIVIGSLLASHTLLGLPVIERLGLQRAEPVTVTVGATVMSDTLSLVVFAVCVSIFTTGFSPSGLALLLAEIVGYIVLMVFGLSRLAGYVLKKVEHEEDAYFIIILCFMIVGGCAGRDHPLARHCRRVPGRARGQCRRARQACDRQAGFHRQVAVHSDLVHRHGLPDQPGGIHSRHP